MKKLKSSKVISAQAGAASRHRTAVSIGHLSLFILLLFGTAGMAYAQTDPWSTAAARLATAFTGPIAKGLALVAIVVGGLQLAFSEGGSRRTVGGLIFGLGLALGATQFMTWLFF
jgi:type IV secretory pathway VirB2 component (pilin)